ncbi:hypothetical protein N656DRAFT_844945 [Canariomyces notabilis]|uniref:Uncharacterized protein n=1 Tax=Canariomyces notabilis TaxID=2074819 RepID=A0AAN6TEJ9_9PEZI|nr:hypothetical protein N656DRAFT_844945 [Canariomyces arenarius]
MAALNHSGSWYPPIVPSEKPPQSASSTFDILLTVYPSSQRTRTSDPNSCMDYCRRLVLSAWTARIRIVETQLIKEQLMLSIGDIPADARAAEVFEKSWQRPWHPRDFGRLVRAKSALESTDWELRPNMDALGIGSESMRTVEAWEADAWQSLTEVMRSLKIRLDIMLQAYMQSISVRETSAANKQARQDVDWRDLSWNTLMRAES